MAKVDFASIGERATRIDVRLSYKIVQLFSEGLYASPNKAIEELVANSFDAGATSVQVLIPDLREQNATIVVIDNGEGMDIAGLRQHWIIGSSNKRQIANLPKNRQQIGKFGIGKLATYVLSSRLTHIAKANGKFFSASMNYAAIEDTGKQIAPEKSIKIPVRTLTEAQAHEALSTWLDTPAFKKAGLPLFGKKAPSSWTVAILSALKPKVHELRLGTLAWVLRTALPLRPDFGIWLNGERLESSKQGKGLIKRWVLGKDLKQFPRPAPKDVEVYVDKNVDAADEKRFSIEVPDLGRVTGFVEAYRDPLTGKSDEIGRSNGFFVYVFGRLINVMDGHFSIAPNELRHGTFSRFRCVVNVDSLDAELRSSRESISEGAALTAAQNLLRGIFNAVRAFIEKEDAEEDSATRLGRKLAASPASISRRPIVELASAVVRGERTARYLTVPEYDSKEEQDAFIHELEQRARSEKFVTALTLDYEGQVTDGLARYDAADGALHINAYHPFVAAFYDDFTGKSAAPLELVAMAEVLIEAQLNSIGVKRTHVDDFLMSRDQLLRALANESGSQSALAVAIALREARNDADKLEEKLCAAFSSLGFDVARLGGKNRPDGIATAVLAADKSGSRQYAISLDAKSKVKDKGKVAAGTVKISSIRRHRDDYKCDHALVVGRDFPAAESSALASEIDDDRHKTKAAGHPKTITLMTIDALADLVRVRPLKQVGLQQIRDLFQLRLPAETKKWVEGVAQKSVPKPPYAKIVSTIEHLQKKFSRNPVKYSALLNELSHLTPPVTTYSTDEELSTVCHAMAQMAPGQMFATSETVELDQSATNVLAAIEAATKTWLDEL